MTRKRSTGFSEDSLDLLLDTITNTFGGVLFLAILVTVLLQFSEPPSSIGRTQHHAQPDILSRTKELTALQDSVRTLRQAETSHKTSLAALRNTSQGKTAATMTLLRDQVESLESEIRMARDRVAITEQTVSHLQDSQRQAEQASQEVLKELALAEAAYREERAKHEMSTGLPQLHTTDRLEYVIAAKHDRVYFIYQNSDGLSADLNTADFHELSQTASSMTVHPNRRRGRPIEEDGFAKSFKHDMRIAPPRSFYVCLLIWRDSFDSFAKLRQTLVTLGYEYRLIVMEEDGEIGLGGGTPLVQ